MNETEITINKLAQNIIDVESGNRWFEEQSTPERRKIIQALNYFILQSHPRPDEIEIAIKTSGLKATYTPCILLKVNSIKEALSKIESLPETEWKKWFTLGINIFRISDSRRRETDCKEGCSHEWHRLSGL